MLLYSLMTGIFCEEAFASAYVDLTCAQETLGAAKRRHLSFVLIHPFFLCKVDKGMKEAFSISTLPYSFKEFWGDWPNLGFLAVQTTF